MTDDHPGYSGLGKDFRRHSTIRHSWKVYARKEGDVLISTNTIEGYFSILKRGINGVYHHVGKQHLHRYLGELIFVTTLGTSRMASALCLLFGKLPESALCIGTHHSEGVRK